MRNFDYLRNAEPAIGLQLLVKAVYDFQGVEVPERASVYELICGEPFSGFIEDGKLLQAAHFVRKVNNRSAHHLHVSKSELSCCRKNWQALLDALLPRLNGEDAAVHEMKFVDDYTEAETRRLFIDLMLEDAGWDVLEEKGAIMPGKACIEVEVQGMPNEHGVGYADYVLFGDNGKPLAVVEAKRTMKDPAIGKHQAELYADCLEAKYGVRPVIYYTNGFQTYIIDGLGYPARPLYAFHTAKDLDKLIKRRGRANITDIRVNDDITNRDYQKMAIHSICDHFNKMHRRGLLVMATGTGKTRVAISLVDVLSRNDWAQNILFLADRTSLVNQAHKHFKKHLPGFTTTILNESREPDLNARIVFSTYQTMINYIDKEEKGFSVGRFDLIIIDEAHRSVFGKYTAILDYFDALMVGLTATPREDVDRSTYDLFGLEGGEPNFAYELGQAVDEDYLVPPTWFSKSTKIMKEGIRYEDLTDEEKKQMEDVWKYELVPARDITSGEIFSYIFNIDTVDKVLTHLMTCGQMVEGGEKIGKSVIFAYNHDHAQLIVERFARLYPEYGSDYCVLIDNQVTYAQNLIDNFSVPAKMPQIAVSVDMLDTGIDLYLEDSQLRFGTFRTGVSAQMVPFERYLSQEDVWTGWDWDSYWLSAFANFKVDLFDDGYFPDKGFRFSIDGRYNFKGYSIDLDPAFYHPEGNLTTADGSVPRYGSVLGSIEGAFSFGPHFTVLPSLYLGWYSAQTDYLHPLHPVSVGGFLPNRYTERQIPFFGFPYGYRYTRPFSAVAQLDLRYRFAVKNFITLRGGLFQDAGVFSEMFISNPVYAVGAEYSRQTIVGPFRFAAQWCDISGGTVYASIGFAF